MSEVPTSSALLIAASEWLFGWDVFDGRLQLARLGANWQLLAQAEASVPLSGDAGSELAVALLLNYELGKLLPGLGGGAATR